MPTTLVNALNTSTASAPETPVTVAQINAAPISTTTAGPLPPSAIQALTAQIASNAQQLSEGEQQAAGVVNSTTGITTRQLEVAGAIAPGSGALTAALISKGMPASQALEGMMTGPTTATTMVNSVVPQTRALESVLSKSATSLQSSGVLTGKESAAQAGGPIMAAAVMGVGAVTSLLGSSNPASGLGLKIPGSIGSLGDNLSSGKLAGGLSDKLTSGGIATSLGGMLDSAKNSVTGALDGLKSTAENAFASVEGSFVSLKGGVTNILGKASGSANEVKLSDASLANKKVGSAKAEVAALEEVVLDAKKTYREDDSQENATALATAEKNLAAAKQKAAKASTSFLSASTASIPGVSSISNTLNSGLNALPGGIGAFATQVSSKTGSNPLTSIIASAKSVSGSSSFDLSKNAGDVMSSVSSSLNGAMKTAMGTATGALDKAKSAASGMLGQLETSLASIGNMPGQIKMPVMSADAVLPSAKAAIAAAQGKLLGDPRIPRPGAVTEETESTEDPDEIVNKQATALAAIEDKQSAVDIIDQKIAAIFEKIAANTISTDEGYSKIHALQVELDAANEELSTAQANYEATVRA
jgi:hypothetical protein